MHRETSIHSLTCLLCISHDYKIPNDYDSAAPSVTLSRNSTDPACRALAPFIARSSVGAVAGATRLMHGTLARIQYHSSPFSGSWLPMRSYHCTAPLEEAAQATRKLVFKWIHCTVSRSKDSYTALSTFRDKQIVRMEETSENSRDVVPLRFIPWLQCDSSVARMPKCRALSSRLPSILPLSLPRPPLSHLHLFPCHPQEQALEIRPAPPVTILARPLDLNNLG